MGTLNPDPRGTTHLALVMDWDDTLCPDTISGLITTLGFDPEAYWEPLDELVHEGWDIVSAYMKGMMDLMATRPNAKALKTYRQVRTHKTARTDTRII